MAKRQSVNFERYARLHPDGQKLIPDWHKRATSADDFESFIYLWIAFNGWAACVTDKDVDSKWRQALTADPKLNDDFARLVTDPSTRTADAAQKFHQLWPIFSVAKLRQGRIDHWRAIDRDRGGTARAYIKAGARGYEPSCYGDHNDEPPLDWGHTLAALYRVRCNLFHGEKARTSGNDRTVVTAARTTLLSFVDEAPLFS